MRLEVHHHFDSIRDDWNDLHNSNPMLSPTWAEAWWSQYGIAAEPFLLAVRDNDDQLIGLVPWFRRTAWGHRMVSFIGNGEVCSDHLSIVCNPKCVEEVLDFIVQELTSGSLVGEWNEIELDGFDVDDKAMRLLLEKIEHKTLTHYRDGLASWYIELPATWDEYLSTLSKSHRKRCRKLYKQYFDSERVERRIVSSAEELTEGFEVLRQLHEARWQLHNLDGVFHGPFLQFHQELLPRFWVEGRLRLQWLLLDGVPAAAEYQFVDDTTIYAYQSGMNPEVLEHQPGNLSIIATLSSAIAEGYKRLDLMRGDEPYKAHWRATRRAAGEVRIWPRQLTSRVRQTGWLLRDKISTWSQKAENFSETPSH